jgi:GT2 family glycosyltransferase
VLDEDFFMYKEDVDLAWRLRLGGWQTWYEPQAVAWHARGAEGGLGGSLPELVRSNARIPRWIKRVSWRNHRLMQLKNEKVGEYLLSLPWILRREVLSLGFTAVVDPRRLIALVDLAAAARSALRKRRRKRSLD